MKKKENKKAELAAKYKSAFDEILGDPYGLEPILGMYEELRKKSAITVVEYENMRGVPSPVNKARPNHLDFFCDIEKAVQDGLSVYQKKKNARSFDELSIIFDNTYWLESGAIFNQKERAEIEQIIGKILSARKISPAYKYFVAIRK